VMMFPYVLILMNEDSCGNNAMMRMIAYLCLDIG